MSFYTDVIEKSPRFHTTHVVKDLSLIEPGTRAAVLAFLKEAREQGHDLRVLETYRSQTRQMELYDQGATHLRNVGCHGYGVAVDLGLWIDGVYQTDGDKYQFFVELAKKHKLISGRDWGTPWQRHSFIDSDHLQRVPIFRQNEMFRGEWYPYENYDPYADMEQNGA